MADKNLTRFYRGNSMRSTFHPGDRLMVTPEVFGAIIPGDVIIFHKSNCLDESEDIVHRVVAITETGLITRGDNNRHRDSIPVQWEQIVGKVKIVESKGLKKMVTGGVLGLRRARLRWAILHLDSWTRQLFWRPYHILRLSGFVAKLWQPTINKIYLQTENGHVVKYIYKQRTVAVWETSRKNFDCRKPFDLVIPRPRNSK